MLVILYSELWIIRSHAHTHTHAPIHSSTDGSHWNWSIHGKLSSVIEHKWSLHLCSVWLAKLLTTVNVVVVVSGNLCVCWCSDTTANTTLYCGHYLTTIMWKGEISLVCLFRQHLLVPRASSPSIKQHQAILMPFDDGDDWTAFLQQQPCCLSNLLTNRSILRVDCVTQSWNAFKFFFQHCLFHFIFGLFICDEGMIVLINVFNYWWWCWWFVTVTAVAQQQKYLMTPFTLTHIYLFIKKWSLIIFALVNY